MANNLEQEIIERQKKVCIKYNADFLLSPFDSIIGVALETFDNIKIPINGLRHSIEKDDMANWYIWAGEFSASDDFFKPIHINHLLEICPKAIDYLGLASGWRFLFDGDYEDVWYDENLLLK